MLPVVSSPPPVSSVLASAAWQAGSSPAEALAWQPPEEPHAAAGARLAEALPGAERASPQASVGPLEDAQAAEPDGLLPDGSALAARLADDLVRAYLPRAGSVQGDCSAALPADAQAVEPGDSVPASALVAPQGDDSLPDDCWVQLRVADSADSVQADCLVAPQADDLARDDLADWVPVDCSVAPPADAQAVEPDDSVALELLRAVRLEPADFLDD
jgi:hypothetical protein